MNKDKRKREYKKGDLIFIIVYFIIYFLLVIIFLIMTPIRMDATYKEVILWDKLVWVLLYAIVVPIIYLFLRSKHQK